MVAWECGLLVLGSVRRRVGDDGHRNKVGPGKEIRSLMSHPLESSVLLVFVSNVVVMHGHGHGNGQGQTC